MLEWDEAIRQLTLIKRGLDFADAKRVFAGRTTTLPDERQPYGERRFITAGWLGDRFVVLVWTQRGGNRRIISMRYGHAEEESYWRSQMDWPG